MVHDYQENEKNLDQEYEESLYEMGGDEDDESLSHGSEYDDTTYNDYD